MEYEQALDQIDDIKNAVARIDDWDYGADGMPQEIVSRLNEALGKFDALKDAIQELSAQHDEVLENPITCADDVANYCAENPEALDDIPIPASVSNELWRAGLAGSNDDVTVGGLLEMVMAP